MVGYGGFVRCSSKSGVIPQDGDLRGDMFKLANNEFGLKPRVFEVCEGQLSGYVQEAAESMSLGLSRVVGAGESLNQGLSG